MPVRRVSKNSRSLTGLVPNTRTASMTAFESSLERDFLLLLDFDPDVEFYEEQPVQIVYYDDTGRRWTYTALVARARAQGKRISRAPIPCGVQERIVDLYRQEVSMHQMSQQLGMA